MTGAEQLSRTVLLFQTDLGIHDPSIVYRALTGPLISLHANSEIVHSLSGQIAISTAAMMMARSGHSVLVDCPDAPLLGYQPPMGGRSFHQAIDNISDQMIDGISIRIGRPLLASDIAFIFGNCDRAAQIPAKRAVSVGWSDWAAELAPWPTVADCRQTTWPIGALGAAVLAASEAAKIAGLALASAHELSRHFIELFAPTEAVRLILAPDTTPRCSDLGMFDVISAGAVSNAFLFALLRVPQVTGNVRAFDEDVSDQSNRNRNMLLTPQFLRQPKVEVFKHFEAGLLVDPINRHFAERDLETLSARVAIGVDDIPTRWLLAKARSSWMGVGATSHFDSMASVHHPAGACAGCLHPHDELIAGPTPTIAFASFLAGLMMAADFLVDVAQGSRRFDSRYRYVNALQPSNPWASPIAPRADCPAECPASISTAA